MLQRHHHKFASEEYQGFSNPSLRWYCSNCQSKVITNLRIDQEMEARCNEYFKIIDSRVTKIEKVLNEKPSVVQVESMIADAIKSNDKDCTTLSSSFVKLFVQIVHFQPFLSFVVPFTLAVELEVVLFLYVSSSILIFLSRMNHVCEISDF
jgi:hypothetical protein